MQHANNLILALSTAGVPDKTVRTLQLSMTFMYSCFEKTLRLVTLVNASYKLAADERIVKTVENQLQAKVEEQKKQLTDDLKALLIEAGCKNSTEIGLAFMKDLEMVNF